MEKEIKFSTRFITETDSRIRICVGNDEGFVWWVYEDDEYMESKKLDDSKEEAIIID